MTVHGGVRRIAGVVLGLAVFLGACGSSGSSAASQTALATEISTAIGVVGGSHGTLGTIDANSALLRLTMSIKGIGQPDITCYLAIAVPAFGPGFAKLTVTELAIWLSDTDAKLPIPARQSAEACFSADSTARLKAHQITPDLDVVNARTVLRAVAVAESKQVGLTAKEAECYAAQTIDGLSDSQLKAGIAGSTDPKIHHPAASVRACLTATRISALAPKLVKATAAQQAADQAQHERTQASIDAEVRAALASTTTTTTAPA